MRDRNKEKEIEREGEKEEESYIQCEDVRVRGKEDVT